VEEVLEGESMRNCYNDKSKAKPLKQHLKVDGAVTVLLSSCNLSVHWNEARIAKPKPRGSCCFEAIQSYMST